MSRRLLFFVVSSVAVSCGADASTEGQARLEIRPPIDDTAPQSFSIGGSEEVEAEHFVDVRGAILLSDGRVVVAEASTQELRVFDASGRAVDSWGGRGEGPGEFTGLDGVYVLMGDTVVAYDLSQGRFSKFDPYGELITTTRDEAGISYTASILTGSRAVRYSDFPRGSDGVVVGDSFEITVRSFDGERLASLGRYPGRTVHRSTSGPARSTVELDYVGRTVVTGGGDRIAVWTPGARTVSVFGVDGLKLSEISLSHARLPTPTEAATAWVRSRAGNGGGSWSLAVQGAVSAVPFPDSLPLVADMMIGEGGDLWVGEYDPRLVHPARWLRYRGGNLEGEISLPGRRARVMQFSSDRVLVLSLGGFDEPLVELFGIRE